MAGRNAKRKLRRVKQQAEEATSVIQQMMMICGQHGRVINFAWELPQVLNELFLLEGAPGPAKSAPGAPDTASSRQESLDRLSEFADIGSIDLADFADKSPPINGAPTAAPHQAAAPPVSERDAEEPPMSMEDMRAQIEAGQDRMLDRLEKKGVKHKFGGGPAEGQKMSRADVPGQKPRSAQPPSPEQAPPPIRRSHAPRQTSPGPDPAFDEDFSDLGTIGTGASSAASHPSQEDAHQTQHEFGPGEGPRPTNRGRVNPATGMALEDARELIARVTGRTPTPPGGNPSIKPRT